jgi:integration host factor subunit alpha
MEESSELARSVTRAALREAVGNCCAGLSQQQARQLVDSTIEEICEALARGESVKLRAFGSFQVRAKRERVGRNPKTGIEAQISARRVLTFKPSPALVARVNGEAVLDVEDYGAEQADGDGPSGKIRG